MDEQQARFDVHRRDMLGYAGLQGRTAGQTVLVAAHHDHPPVDIVQFSLGKFTLSQTSAITVPASCS